MRRWPAVQRLQRHEAQQREVLVALQNLILPQLKA
jgi:hypothetical protein